MAAKIQSACECEQNYLSWPLCNLTAESGLSARTVQNIETALISGPGRNILVFGDSEKSFGDFWFLPKNMLKFSDILKFLGFLDTFQ